MSGGGVDVPPRPKRPLSPYFRFLGQVRDQVRKENPSLKPTGEVKQGSNLVYIFIF